MKVKKIKGRTPVTISPTFISSGDSASLVQQIIIKQCSRDTPVRGLDLLPGCLEPGTVTVICSLPGIGKSAYLMNLALEAQDKKRNLAIFITEASIQEFSFKAICKRARINGISLMRGRLAREKLKYFGRAMKEFSAPGIYFASRRVVSTDEIEKDVKFLSDVLGKDRRKLGAIVVDSVNYMCPQGYYQEVFQNLKDLASKLGLAVICSFDVNLTLSMRDGDMKLGDIRLTGLQEQWVDQVYYLHRPEYFNRTDPTIVGQAVLRRLYPFIGDRADICLRFDQETIGFHRQ